MGILLYGSPPSEFVMEDRLLAHLKVAIVTKLRRGEPFLLSWDSRPDAESGRMSLWVHPAIPLQFRFDETERPPLNRAWIESLSLTSLKIDGMHVSPEPPSGE
jgi:hypothetical protein